jgi:signal transduction histidine kinase
MSPSPAACLPANERRGALQRSLRQRWSKRAKHQLRAQPLCEMCLTRGQVTAACICDHVEPHGGDWNRFLAHSARAITLAHRAPLINTTPHARRVWRYARRLTRRAVNGVSVSTELQEDLPQIMADPTQLQQVILNLIKNAIETMTTDLTTIRALRLVTTNSANSTVSLIVQDSGPGITPKSASQIFDPFFTTKSFGMGLGLSISRRIIEDHGGDLRLTETSSNGCTFEITLPSVATGDSRVFGRAIATAVGSIN